MLPRQVLHKGSSMLKLLLFQSCHLQMNQCECTRPTSQLQDWIPKSNERSILVPILPYNDAAGHFDINTGANKARHHGVY